MEKGTMHYEHVDIDDKWMKLAYKLGKTLYMVNKWNLKTTPIAVVVKDEQYLAHGICADGAHPLQAKCERLNEKGTSYDLCPHCREEEHAERKALLEAYDKDLNGAAIYVYGHYKLCESCIKALNNRGIYKCFLLKDAETLFDRHNANTVLGTEKQFAI